MQHWRCAAWPMTAECWVRHRMSGKNQKHPPKRTELPDSGANRRPESRGVAQKPFQATMAPLPWGKERNFATLTVTGRFRRSSDEPTIFVVGAVKRRPMQNDEEQPLDSSGDPKATNVAQDHNQGALHRCLSSVRAG